MSEPEEDFLARWSRRKREAAAAPDQSEPEQPDGVPEADQPAAAETAESAPVAAEEGKAESTPQFDLSKLPSLDSITAETDIRPFLAAGVPADLKTAALRRVWSADPKIRDFIEMAENQWDFNTDIIPGFDRGAPLNVQEMVAEIFGQVRKVAEHANPSTDATSEDSALAQSSVSREPAGAADDGQTESEVLAKSESSMSDIDQSGGKTAQNEAAPQQQENAEVEMPMLPRRHGSALPS